MIASRYWHPANFAVLQNAAVISKLQWSGFGESHLTEVSLVFSATKNLLTFAL
jgi:hypothetical protein